MNVSNNVYHFCLGEKNNNSNLKVYSPNKYKEEKNKKKFICRCKKSNCMKLYCDCFANGEKCIGCNCVNCSNVIGNEINIAVLFPGAVLINGLVVVGYLAVLRVGGKDLVSIQHGVDHDHHDADHNADGDNPV